MAKGLIGLDIGASSIKIIQLKRTRGNFELEHFGIAPLPPQTIVDGQIMNTAAVKDAIKTLVSLHQIRVKDCAISISGLAVTIKKISVSAMSEDELADHIKWEAEQYVPFDMNDVNIDYQVLDTGAGGGQMDVLLVAGKKDIIQDYVELVRDAGLEPKIVDVDAFAVENAFEVNYPIPPDETIALINIGASTTNINVISRRVTAFTRDVTMGGFGFTEEIQKQLNLSYQEAEALKLGGDPTADSESVIPQEVERIIQEVGENLASEVRRSLEFYASSNPDSDVSKIYVCGGSAKLTSLQRILQNRTGVPVEPFYPFRKIHIDDRVLDVQFLESVAPMAAVSVGLGLRRFDD